MPEPSEDKESSASPTPGSARKPGPSRFLVPAGQRIAEDAVASVPAASFLSKDKICGKLTIPSSTPASPLIAGGGSHVDTDEEDIDDAKVENGDASDEIVASEDVPVKRGRGRPPKERRNSSVTDSEEPKVKRGPGRPSKDRSSLPGIVFNHEEIKVKRGPGRPRNSLPGPTIVRSSSVSSTCSSASSSTSTTRSDRKRRCRSTGSEEPLNKVDKTEAISGAEENNEDIEITFTTTKERKSISNNVEQEKTKHVENFQLKSCGVQLKTLHSKPGPFSLKKFTNEVQIKTPAVTAAPTTAGAAVSARETRESISIEVVDEFVTDEISPCKTPDELTVEKPKVEAVDTDGDESSVEEEVEIVTTKSGRKIMKPKMQHFITTFKGSKIPDLDSEMEEDEEEVVSKERMEELKKSLPSMFEPGDLAWARLGVAPYWPCTITLDPDQKIHSNVSLRGKKPHREYHVQFFGRVQRAWVPDVSLLKFEGVASFQEKADEAKKATGNLKKKILKAFTPSSSARQHWNEALKKMLEVKELSNENRLNYAKRRFEEAGKLKLAQQSQPGEKRKHNSSSSSMTSTSKPSDEVQLEKRPKLFFEAESMIKAIPAQILEENRRKLKSGFKLFRLANEDKLKKDFQRIEELDRKISRMWNQLTRKERQFYCEESLKISASGEGDDNDSVVEMEVDESNSMTSVSNSCEILDNEEEIVLEEDSIQEVSTPASASTTKSSSRSVSASPAVSEAVVEKAVVIANKRQSSSNTTSMIGLFKKEGCCLICENVSLKPGDLIKCRGICQNSFHLECIKLEESANNDAWKCEECTTGNHPCMLCKSTNGDRTRCSIPSCGKFFHRSCLKNGLWPQARFSETQLTCPGHMCHTCASDNPQDPFMKYNTKLVRCIRCPTAYHAQDYCITAGSIQITATQIVCPKHYTPPKGKKGASTHINTSWCFICSNGGTLICCELCPASFHAECLRIDPPEGLYYCDSCETGKLPLYGEVLWVKLGNYRWWPSKVLHPSEIPDNIDRLPHDIGEFPIQFCGTKEYFWMNRGRCYPYQEGDSDKIPGSAVTSTTSLAVSFRKGLTEAAEVFDAYMEAKNRREAANANKVQTQPHIKPPLFSKIKSNKPYGDVTLRTIDPVDSQVCECDPTKDSPCGKDSDCLNRMLMLECCPSMCRAGDKCGNMQFQRRVYPTMGVCRTSTRGWGLFIKQDVKKGDFLIEYVGELITTEEFRRRVDHMLNDKDAEQNYYYMVMDNSRVIDAGPKGNVARFMNHSCDPNCETQKWTVNGDTRIGLFALEDITAGTELTFNYQLEAFGEVKKACLCGAKNCSGFIGEKPTKDTTSNSNSNNQNNNAVGKKKKMKKVKPIKVWEDLCFRCFDGGELLMCDYKSCPKVYHMSCVEHETRPREKWFCPWHHCVTCGSNATQHCIHCPNAYCTNHNTLKTHPVLGKICNEHTDEFDDILKFYTKCEGVGRVVQDPNHPIQFIVNDSNKNQNVLKPKELSQAEPAKPAVVIVNENCQESDCLWSGPRDELRMHYAQVHNKSEAEIYQLTPRRIPTPKRSIVIDLDTIHSDSVKSNDQFIRNSERLYECPGCNREMRASLIRRHILSKHPEMNIKAGISDGDALENALAKVRTVPSQQQEDRSQSSNEDEEFSPKKKAEGFVQQRRSLPNSHMNLTPVSEACVMCQAPGCRKYIHHSNMARHWRCWHPELNKADFVMKRPPATKSATGSPTGSPLIFNSNSENQLKDQSFDRRLSENSLTDSPSIKLQSNADRLRIANTTLPMCNGLYACRSGNCDYMTRYNSNMWRHRRKYNHFMDTSPSTASNGPAKLIVIDATKGSASKESPTLKSRIAEMSRALIDHSQDIETLVPEGTEDVIDIDDDEEAEMEFEVIANKKVACGNIQIHRIVSKEVKKPLLAKKPEIVQTAEAARKPETAKAIDIVRKPDVAKTADVARKPEVPKKLEEVKKPEPQATPEKIDQTANPLADKTSPRNKITAYFLPVPKSVDKVNKVQGSPESLIVVRKDLFETGVTDTSENIISKSPAPTTKAATTVAVNKKD